MKSMRDYRDMYRYTAEHIHIIYNSFAVRLELHTKPLLFILYSVDSYSISAFIGRKIVNVTANLFLRM